MPEGVNDLTDHINYLFFLTNVCPDGNSPNTARFNFFLRFQWRVSAGNGYIYTLLSERERKRASDSRTAARYKGGLPFQSAVHIFLLQFCETKTWLLPSRHRV